MSNGIYGSSPMPDPVVMCDTGIETCDLCGDEHVDFRKVEVGKRTLFACPHCRPVTCIVCREVFSSQDDDGTHLCDDCYDDPGERRSAS